MGTTYPQDTSGKSSTETSGQTTKARICVKIVAIQNLCLFISLVSSFKLCRCDCKIPLCFLFYGGGGGDTSYIRQMLPSAIPNPMDGERSLYGGVADPGFLSRIRIFPSRIPDPGSKRFQIPDAHPHQRLLSIFNPEQCFSALGMFIPDPASGS